MDAEFRTLLVRAETAIEESRRLLSAGNEKMRLARQKVLQAQALIDEDRFARMEAVRLSKRWARLLRRSDDGTRTSGNAHP